MATVGLTITAEMEEIHDAVALIHEIHCRLAKMHGDDFRKLDRAIDRFIEDPQDCVDVRWLGGGKIMAFPKGQFTEIFREARRLGVID